MGNCRGAPSAAQQRRDEERAKDGQKRQPAGSEEEDLDRHLSGVSSKVFSHPVLGRGQPTMIDVMACLIEEHNHPAHSGPQGGDLHWLNWGVQAMWENVRAAVSKVVQEAIKDSLKANVPTTSGRLFNMKKFDLGDTPPELGPVDVRKVKAQTHPGVEFTIGFHWNCNGGFDLEISPGLSIGIKKVTLAGTVSLTLRPILDDIPIVGGIQVTMIAPPRISWEVTGLAQASHFPGIEKILKNAITTLLTDLLVIPNRIFVHWLYGREGEFDITEMQSPRPEAVLRLGVIEAKVLKSDEWHWLGQAGCNLEARICIGHRTHMTPVRKSTQEPHWGDEGWYDFLMFTPNQLLTLEIYDEGWNRHTLIAELLVADTDDTHGDGIARKMSLLELLAKTSGDMFKIYERSSDKGAPLKEIGEVRLEFCLHSLVPWKGCKPTEKHGMARADWLISVQLHGIRGLPPEEATGSRVKVTVTEGETITELWSCKSTYVEVSRETLGEGKATDIAVQRLVEYLSLDGKDTEAIAQISGLSVNEVKTILKSKPSFTARFHRSLHFPVKNAEEATIQFKLVIPSEEGKAGPGIELTEPIKLKEVVWDEENLRYEKFLHLERQQKTSKSPLSTSARNITAAPSSLLPFAHVVLEGHFELDMSVQLRSFDKVQDDLAATLSHR